MSKARLEKRPAPSPGTFEQILSIRTGAIAAPFDRGEDEKGDSQKLYMYLLGLFADRVCGGDYQKPADVLPWNSASSS